jgi:hypothetical protein
LLCSLALTCCRSKDTSVSEQKVSEQTEPADPEPVDPALAEPQRSADHAERVADLDALCRALDHDYGDGTLSDYYAKVVPETAWGRDRLREGEESITPGRLLQKASTDLGADLEGPDLAGCRKLFDEIDELE